MMSVLQAPPPQKRLRLQERGFTLIELSLVIIITGIIMLPLIQIYASYLQNLAIKTTRENVYNASSFIARFSVSRYPCPSDRSLPPGSPNFGADICRLPGFNLSLIPNCNTSGTEQGVCKTVGARDTGYDTVGPNDLEVTLIGGIPLRITDPMGADPDTIISGLNSENTQDAWGKRLSYAVSFPSSDPTRTEGFSRFKVGNIAVKDEFGNDTAGTNSDAQFVIFSHGPDGLGGYAQNNAFFTGCNMAQADRENCDGDSTFAQGLATYAGTVRYDDYMYVETEQSANIWSIISINNTPSAHITTIPTGRVMINMSAPVNPPSNFDVRLDVNGDIKADTVRTQRICKKDGSVCIPTNTADTVFGSQKVSGANQNDCPTGYAVVSIGSNKVTCQKVDITTLGVQVLCPPTTWVEQILTDGKIKCTGGIICPGGAGCL